MIAPPEEYHRKWAEPSTALPELRQLLSLIPELEEAGAEVIAERLGTEPWEVEAAFEALCIEGEVLG